MPVTTACPWSCGPGTAASGNSPRPDRWRPLWRAS
jgi:hypothetical protein